MEDEPCNLIQITNKKIPITIVTGFLGAGKTTFIHYVLTEKHGKRIAVIENEFGKGVGIEGALLIKDDMNQQQEFIELPNGCLCCTVKNDMLVTIENLVKKKDRFDYIFIEPSGLAHPGTLAANFWVDDALESDVYLDGIVTFVDAKHILQHLNEVKPENVINEAQSQVAFADRIIINKKDLVSTSELQAVERRIRQVNADAPIFIAERSQVPLDMLLDIKAFDPSRYVEIEPECKHIECSHEHDNHSNNNHSHKHGNSHDNSIITVTITEPGSTSLEKFNSWLGTLLWDDTGNINIFRCKGQVSFQNEDQKYVLQGVHTIFTVEPTTVQWKKEEPRINRLLFIGRGIDSESLTKSFVSNCL